MYQDDRPTKTIKTGLTLAQAQKHCQDPATSGDGWFDGYECWEYDKAKTQSKITGVIDLLYHNCKTFADFKIPRKIRVEKAKEQLVEFVGFIKHQNEDVDWGAVLDAVNKWDDSDDEVCDGVCKGDSSVTDCYGDCGGSSDDEEYEEHWYSDKPPCPECSKDDGSVPLGHGSYDAKYGICELCGGTDGHGTN